MLPAIAMLSVALPDSAIAWDVILTIGMLASIGVSVTTLMRSNKTQCRQIEPQPFKVEMAKEFPTRPEFERLDCDMRDLRSEMKQFNAKLDTIGRDNEMRAQRLHERIDRLPGEMIATLRNTGNLQ